jgi:leader peptidase (prepilin peptidase) / N-methyltransferase
MIAVFFLFLFGAVVGSFLNVLIYRTTHGEDWVRGRSKCDSCNKQIAWYDNIPLLSFIILGGKCRHCKKPISIQHPVIEAMSGILFVWWYAMGFAFFQLSQRPHTIIQPAFWLAVGILLLIIFATDWMYQIIPDYATVALGILALVYRLYLSLSGIMRWEDFWMAMASGMVMMGLLWFLWWVTRGKGLGFGDVKFALVMGWLLGWPRSLVAFFLAFVLGAMVGVILILSGKKKMKSKIAFGPFLVLGTVIALVVGSRLWQMYWNLM